MILQAEMLDLASSFSKIDFGQMIFYALAGIAVLVIALIAIHFLLNKPKALAEKEKEKSAKEKENFEGKMENQYSAAQRQTKIKTSIDDLLR